MPDVLSSIGSVLSTVSNVFKGKTGHISTAEADRVALTVSSAMQASARAGGTDFVNWIANNWGQGIISATVSGKWWKHETGFNAWVISFCQQIINNQSMTAETKVERFAYCAAVTVARLIPADQQQYDAVFKQYYWDTLEVLAQNQGQTAIKNKLDAIIKGGAGGGTIVNPEIGLSTTNVDSVVGFVTGNAIAILIFAIIAFFAWKHLR